jgi:hypothetical protein
MNAVAKSLLMATVLWAGVASARPAAAQALALNVSVPIAQPVYYYDPYYPAAYQTYFGYYYPTYNWLPSAYYATYSNNAIQVASTSTYYYGYPYTFGYPYSYAGVGATYGGYSYPYAYNLTYGLPAYRYMFGNVWPTSTYYATSGGSPYYTGYYPSSYYGNYYPAYGYYGTGTYGVW